MDAPSKRVELVPAKRRAIILEHLRANGAASIQDLTEAVGGSQSTVRRDLDYLEENGYLERTHGAAVLLQQTPATFETEALVNAELSHREKVHIGREAASRLAPGNSVFLDGSTTVMEAARAAASRAIPLTIVTNSLVIAQFCATVRSWRVLLPGGSVRPGFMNLAGQPGEDFIKTIHADLCLCGASAVSGTLLTDNSLEVASMKRAMISAARKSILLVDSSKFKVAGFCTLCDVSDLHEVITDDGIKPDALAALKSSERKITVVSTSHEE
jgi:DeoR/GlpR family transcriptional regulator of sugar metabolism